MSMQAVVQARVGPFFFQRLCEGRGICLGRVQEFGSVGSRSFPRQGQGICVGRVEEFAFPGQGQGICSVGSRNLPR